MINLLKELDSSFIDKFKLSILVTIGTSVRLLRELWIDKVSLALYTEVSTLLKDLEHLFYIDLMLLDMLEIFSKIDS